MFAHPHIPTHDELREQLGETLEAVSLLRLLASLGASRIEQATLGLWRDDLDRSWADALALYLESLPAADVESFESRSVWLFDTEAVALAERGAEQLLESERHRFAVDVGAVIQPFLDTRRAELTWPLLWLHTKQAEVRRGLFGEIFPWTVVAESSIPDSPEDSSYAGLALNSWTAEELVASHEEALRSWVSTDEGWRESYRQLISQRAAEIVVPIWRSETSFDVAESEEELEAAACLLHVALPHLGPRQYLDVRHHARGAYFRSAVATELVSPGTTFKWGDDILGTLATRVAADTPTRLEEAWHQVCGAREIASGRLEGRAGKVANALARELGAGEYRTQLATAHATFENALDCDDDLETWVGYALALRCQLELAASELSDVELFASLTEADDKLAPFGDALLVLSEDRYEQSVGEAWVDENAWWGARERLDASVPAWKLDRALKGIDSRSADPVYGFAPLMQRAEQSRRAGTAFLAKSAESPSGVGETTLLLFDPENECGRLARLRVSYEEGGKLWAHDALRSRASAAVRNAYRFVSRLMPSGPRYQLADHRIDIEPLDDRPIDGDSLALPIAVAFASLWLESPLLADIAFTGGLKESTGLIEPTRVGGVREKTLAFVAARQGKPTSIAASPAHDADVAASGASFVSVPTLNEAFAAAGLDLSSASFVPVLGDRRTRKRRLGELKEAVDLQQIADRAAYDRPWTVVGDEILLLVDSLERETQLDATEFCDALTRAALAYLHAGDTSQAFGVVHSLRSRKLLESVRDPAVRVLIEIITLEWAIDQRGDIDGARHALLRELESTPEEKRILISGKAHGQIGQAYMHQRRLAEALPELRRAVTEHESHAQLQHEIGRSQVYLATALRMAHRFDDALATLNAAEKRLLAHTKPESEQYFQSCLMYWFYERARLALELGEARSSLAWTTKALELSHVLAWPTIGILRTRAWAFRELGRDHDADACVQEIRRRIGGSSHPVFMAILHEADGRCQREGEVY